MFPIAQISLLEFSIYPAKREYKLWNRQGSTQPLGTVVALDITRSQAEVTHGLNPTGDGSSIWENFILPTTQHTKTGLMGVITEVGGIADNARGAVQIAGLVDKAFCIAAGTLSPGLMLVATTAGDLRSVPTVNERSIAFYNDATDASIATHELKAVVFNGFGSFASEGGT